MPGARTAAAGSYALELDGKDAGPLKSASGGDAFADVVAEAARGYFAKKHIANVKWTPLKVSVGVPMGKSLSDWIAGTVTGTPAPKKGAVVERDAAGAVRAKRAFDNALISSVAFPACDGASKGAGYLTVELVPGAVTQGKASGKPAVGAKQKVWVTSSFKLEIDGIDTTGVSRIEPFTIRQTVVDQPAGGARTRIKTPTSVEFPNLVVTVAASRAKPWSDWFDSFVLQGKNSDTDEKNGTLRLLAADLKAELGQVRLFNLGIYKLAAADAPAEAVKRVVAELYCERMELALP